MNRNFGKLNETGAITYAPSVLNVTAGLITRPTEAQYLAAGWLKIAPSSPSPAEGYHVSGSHWEAQNGQISRAYEYTKDEAAPITISKAKVAAAVDSMGKTAAFFAWLNTRAAYATVWFDGSPTIPYDATANESDLSSLIAALGIAADQIPALIAQVKEG